jgi:ferredoxin
MVNKTPQNVEGRFYVDTHCINCSLCSEIAPDIFATNHHEGYEYVRKQPQNEAEHQRVAEAMGLCPARSIQDSG